MWGFLEQASGLWFVVVLVSTRELFQIIAQGLAQVHYVMLFIIGNYTVYRRRKFKN
jgi:hypothetical protein